MQRHSKAGEPNLEKVVVNKREEHKKLAEKKAVVGLIGRRETYISSDSSKTLWRSGLIGSAVQAVVPIIKYR